MNHTAPVRDPQMVPLPRAPGLMIERGGPRCGWDTDGGHDDVCKGLSLGMPQRQQIPEDKELVSIVRDLAQERSPEPDRLPGLLADYLELQHGFPDALPCLA